MPFAFFSSGSKFPICVSLNATDTRVEMTGPITWEFLGYLMTAAGAVLTAVAFVMRLLAARDQRISKVEADLNAYKLKVSEHYATKDGVTRSLAAMQLSLERLVERIDSLVDNLVIDKKNNR